MPQCDKCGAPIDLAPDGDPCYDNRRVRELEVQNDELLREHVRLMTRLKGHDSLAVAEADQNAIGGLIKENLKLKARAEKAEAELARTRGALDLSIGETNRERRRAEKAEAELQDASTRFTHEQCLREKAEPDETNVKAKVRELDAENITLKGESIKLKADLAHMRAVVTCIAKDLERFR